MKTLVFGHRNPDTDAICSAITYADLLRQTTMPDAIAACCGAPNLRTEFALKAAGVPAPRIIMDVRPEMSELCRRDPVVVREGEVFFEVYNRMQKNGVGTAPVVDVSGNLFGMITLLDLLQVVFEEDADPLKSRLVETSVDKIRQAVDGTFQHVDDPDSVTPMLLMVGAMSAGVFVERLGDYPAEQLVIVSGDRPTIQRPAIERGIKALVITGGHRLPDDLLSLAKKQGVTVITCLHGTATTTIRLKTARSIDSAIKRDYRTVSSRQNVAEVKQFLDRDAQRLYPVVDDNGQMIGVISRNELSNPARPKLVLVDHNELTQAVSGADEADIVEVLDHHRLGGGLKSTNPIRFVNEPVGSTCTLVARQYRTLGVTPSPGIALCMASGIISDTLFLRSPTTTGIDREIIDWLRDYCLVDLDQFAMDFFQVGSSLRRSDGPAVVREDCKEFVENGMRFSISQIEEIGFELFWERKDQLMAALDEMARTRRLEFSALLVTDIVSNGSLLLMSHEPESWDGINYPRLERHLYQLDGVVSRKKQLLPLLTKLMANVES